MPSPPSADFSLSAFGPIAPLYEKLMAGVPYRLWVEYIESVWARHGLRPNAVLDLACGTGTVSRLLARRGYQLVGVDLSPGMIESARHSSQAETISIPFYQQDAAELNLPGHWFDAAVSLFDSLNYIVDPTRLHMAFARVFAHLKGGGSFLFDVNTEYALAEGMFNQSCSRRDEPLHYRWRSHYDRATRICTVRMNFSYDTGQGTRETFIEVHRQRAYPKDELVAWLRAAGFAEVFVYDAYTFHPPKKHSDRLFYLALKT